MTIPDFNIEHLEESDLEHVAEMCKELFGGHQSLSEDSLALQFLTEIPLSYVGVHDGEIIGCYLFNEDWISKDSGYTFYEYITGYRNKKGIQGLVLALKPEYRGRGYGRLLRDLPLTSGCDYVWGYHLKTLNNLDHWIRYGRRLIGESETCYMTLMDLKTPTSE